AGSPCCGRSRSRPSASAAQPSTASRSPRISRTPRCRACSRAGGHRWEPGRLDLPAAKEPQMSYPIRLGYKASAEQFGPSRLLDYAVLAEDVGFDTVFISDHLQPWNHNGGHAPAALPWLGALGARTSRIVMGTSVLTPTFRYHPGLIAQAFGTLGELYPD